MTSTQRAIEGLSPEARSAMINAGSSKIGTRVLTGGVAPATFVELAEWGLIGQNDGLTRQGSIVREALVAAALEEAFG